MTEEQFDQYPFRINTEIKWMDEWFGIKEVWFTERKIGIFSGQMLDYTEVQGARY